VLLYLDQSSRGWGAEAEGEPLPPVPAMMKGMH